MRSLITNARELLARLMEEEDDSSDDETSSVASTAHDDDLESSSRGGATRGAEDDPTNTNADSGTAALLPPQAGTEAVAPPPSPTVSPPPTAQEQRELVVDLTASDDARGDQSAEDDEDKDDDDDEAVEVVGTVTSGRSEPTASSAARPLRLSTNAPGGIGTRFMGIIVDDDDSDDDSDNDREHDNESGEDDNDDDAVVVTDTVAPATAPTAANAAAAPSAQASPSRLGRKRPRSEMASASPNDVVVVETQVVFKSQPTECLICCDACTIAGPHRLVALKCGHLFGRQCIERWILSRKVCPNCNVAVRKTDVRPLFSDHVAVVDNAGIAEMTEKFEAEREKRIQLEKELALIEQQHQNEVARQKREVQRLNEMLRNLQRGVSASKPSATSLPTQQQRDGPSSASKARWR